MQKELTKTLKVSKVDPMQAETERYQTTIVHVRNVAGTVRKKVVPVSNYIRR